jgi:hypothetical protein
MASVMAGCLAPCYTCLSFSRLSMGTVMKDAALLLSTGLVCSVGAWAFWSYLDQDAFVTII